MGAWHAHAVRRAGGRLLGVVDPQTSRAAALARRHRGAEVFADLPTALAAGPDVVHVCTPSASHVPQVEAALAASRHVLAEKPLAPTAAETERLLNQAGAAGRLLVPVHQFLFQRGILRLLDRLPTLGSPVQLEIEAASTGGGAGANETDMVAGEILPHFLALARRLLGITLAEQDWRVSSPRSGEWRVMAVPGSVSLGFLVSLAARPPFARLRLLGDRGSARVDLFHGYVVFERGTASRFAKAARPFTTALGTLAAAGVNLARRTLEWEPAYPGLTELTRRFYRAIGGKGPTPVPAGESLDIARARDRIRELLPPR